MSLSQGAEAPPVDAPRSAPNEVMDVPDAAAETADEPSDWTEPDTRLLDTMSDGHGLSRLHHRRDKTASKKTNKQTKQTKWLLLNGVDCRGSFVLPFDNVSISRTYARFLTRYLELYGVPSD